jgi:hypothetical protein
MRTARSRTSGEKRFDFLLMAPSSQSVEPPQNPGRFILHPVLKFTRQLKCSDSASRLEVLNLLFNDRAAQTASRVHY